MLHPRCYGGLPEFLPSRSEILGVGGFLARRRRYKKRGDSFLSNLDFSLITDNLKEIIALALGVLGIILILALMSQAGQLGEFFIVYLNQYFGTLGYFAAFFSILISLSILLPDKFEIKLTSWVGIITAFLALSGLVHPSSGEIGLSVRSYAEAYVGLYIAYILLFLILIISVMIIFDIPISDFILNIKERFTPDQDKKTDIKVHGANESQSKVSVFTTVKDKIGLNGKVTASPVTQVQTKAVLSTVEDSNWQMPPFDLLELSNTKATSGNIAKNVETIQKTLSDFSIDVSMGDVNVGPTVTQYTLKPKEGIKLNQITARANDLALSLAAHPIRIEAPIPGKAAVGVEIPNKVPALVTLREILEDESFKGRKSNLSISLGRDVAGSPMVVDLKKMPHLLIAGATGSGKSICLNSIITSFLYQNSPSTLRMILVDPKRVEFTRYNGLPHLLCPVITEVDKTVNALKWVVSEMDRRFKLFASTGRRDIESYNTNPTQGKLPYIVIVIDELADLMAQSGREVEAVIVRLAQMARAVGIHLIVATQRPSVDVITGLIKANIISRIAFAVASQIDSRTILDMSGAEKLLGNGDMLYIGADFGKPKRVQGNFISEKEVSSVTDFIKSQAPPQYDESIINYSTQRSGVGGSGSGVDDDLFEDAKECVIQAGKASASLLQRRLRVGYARAARLLDILESEGIIGPPDGAKPRDVMISPSELAFERQIHEDQYQKAVGSTSNQNTSVGTNYSSIDNGIADDNKNSDEPEELTEVDLR